MNRQCKFGLNCHRIKCKYDHPHHRFNHPTNLIPQTKICYFGQQCHKLPNCKFYHPELQQSQPEQCQLQHDNMVLNYETQSQPNNYNFKHFNCAQSEVAEDDGKQSAKTQEMAYYYGCGIKENENEYNNRLVRRQSKSEQLQVNQCSKVNFNALNQIHQGQQQYLQKMLQQFFNVRLVKSKKFNEIYQYIYGYLQDLSQVSTILYQIELLEQQFNFTYFKLVKTILKYDMEYEKIHEKLSKEQKIYLLKQLSLNRFHQQFPNPIEYQVLDQGQLMDKFQFKNKQHGVFLVDGNNVLCALKRLRKFYQSKDNQIYSEGQFRLRWLLSEVTRCILFFDVRKTDELRMKQIAERHLYQDEIEGYEKQSCYFAREFVEESEDEQQEDNKDNQGEQGEVQQNQDQSQVQVQANQKASNEKVQKQKDQQLQQSEISNEQSQQKQSSTLGQEANHKNLADNLIIEWLQKYQSQHKQNTNTNIILITADKGLIQRALSIMDTLHISSGQPFISYCKEYIRRKYFSNKKKKGIIKRIFVDPVEQL